MPALLTTMSSAAERVERGLDDLVAVLDRVVVGDGLAAGGLDLGDHLVGRARELLPSPWTLPPRSLTTTLAPARGQQQRVGAAEPAAGAGDEGDASVEAKKVGHDWLSLSE